jgi:multicomponent Na+:H+ antiporter subunit B
MSRPLRFAVLGIGLAGVAVLLGLAFARMPGSGTGAHPYRDAAVAAAVAHDTANVVSAVNFDQRGLDTMGEETILFGSVLAVAALLRPEDDERTRRTDGGAGPLEAARLGAYVLLPLTLVVGADVVAHGHVTPGGGFQGGVVLATGLHLLYVAGGYRSLERLRSLPWYEDTEALGTASFTAMGFAGLAVSGSFLADVLPGGTFGQLLSAGTVPVLNGAVGVAVASGCVVLLAQFIRQVHVVPAGDGDGGS